MKALSTLNSRLSTFTAYILLFTALCGCKSKKDYDTPVFQTDGVRFSSKEEQAMRA